MKSLVKAQSLADLNKPPQTWVVPESEVTFKQQLRSAKPTVAYHLSPASATLLGTKHSPLVVTNQPVSSPKPPSAPLPHFSLDDTVNVENSPLSTIDTEDPVETVQLSPVEIDGNVALEVSEELDEVPENTLEQDENDELMAEERTIAPIQFSGSALEDAENWLRHFNNYCTYKAYDDAKRLGLFKVLLAGGAATWLDSLQQATLNDWNGLREAFLQRYLTPEFMHFKSARLIFNTKMQKGETVDDYVAKMQQLARSIQAEEKMVRFAVLNGLRPEIANFVTQKQPKTMTELLDAARIAELTNPTTSETDTTVSAQLAGVQEQLKQLTAKWEGTAVASVNSNQDSRRPRSPPRTPSPRRVRFADDGTDRQYRRYDSPNRFTRGFSSRSRFRYPRRGVRGRGYVQSFNAQPSFSYQTPNFYGGQQDQTSMMSYQMQPQCPKCGGGQHQSFNECPAVNRNCRFCLKKGHFVRLCRAAARAAAFNSQ